MADNNDFRFGDGQHALLRKILARLAGGVGLSSASVNIVAEDIEIGGVEIKNGTDDTRAKVTGSAPGSGDNGLVVRNIPSGTQPVSGTVTIVPSGTQTVSGTVTITPSGTQAVSVADGSDVAQGAKADAAITNPATSGSVIAFLKGLLTELLLIVTSTGSTATSTATTATNTGTTATNTGTTATNTGTTATNTGTVATNTGTIATNTTRQGTLTDRSGTISSGGVAQTVMNANGSRKYLLIENVSDTDCWINFTTTAVAANPSVLLKANGGSLVMDGAYVSTEAISIIGATTGKAFTAKEG